MKTFILKINILVFAVVIGLSGCSKNVAEKTAEKPDSKTSQEDSVVTSVNITAAQFKNAGIKLGYLENKQLSEFIKATGYIEVPPQYFAKVSTYIGGVVKTVNVQEGDFVKKGQTIITLEHPDLIKLQEEYISSKNHLLFIEKEYLRQKELFENKVAAGKSFQEAESKYNAEQGKVLSLENQLTMLSISIEDLDKGKIERIVKLKAPIQGYIGHLNISQGAYAEPNKALFDITDNSHLIAHLDIFEKDISKVRIGQKLYVSLPNQEGMTTQEIEGKIYLIGKSVDNETKTVSIRANITDKRKHTLIPGMFVNANINIVNKDSKALPVDAVVRAGKKEYIFMATDEWCVNPNAKSAKAKEASPKIAMASDSISLSYKMVEVKTGAAMNGYVGVIPVEKISDSTVMAVKGAYFLISQLKSGETVGCCAAEESETKK